MLTQDQVRRTSRLVGFLIAMLLPYGVASQTADSVVMSVFVANAVTAIPLAGATIEIIGRNVSRTTDALGEAYLPRLASGFVRIRAVKVGFQPVEQNIVLGLADTLDISIGLTPVSSSHVLKRVDIVASRPEEYLQDFEVRKNMGLGKFLTASQLDSAKHEALADQIARRFTGVRAEWNPNRMAVTFVSKRGWTGFNAHGDNRCSVRAYVDGIKVDGMDMASIQSGDVAGVEFYPNAPPVRFSDRAGCGVLLVWMKR